MASLSKLKRVFRRCISNLNNNFYDIDLLPIDLGGLDIAIGMD